MENFFILSGIFVIILIITASIIRSNILLISSIGVMILMVIISLYDSPDFRYKHNHDTASHEKCR